MLARTRPTASSATTPASGTGWPPSAAARSWSRRPGAWWMSALPSSPASPEMTGSPTLYLCCPKTLHKQAQAAGQELNEVLRLLDPTDSNEDLKHAQQAW